MWSKIKQMLTGEDAAEGSKAKGSGKGTSPAAGGGQLSLADQRRILETGGHEDRLALAGRDDVRPEVLYYLAEDDSSAIRKLIAGNEATPVQADALLMSDEDDEVRSELARKIGRIVPDLPPSEKRVLRDKAIEVLESLAQDQLPKVRAIIAEEIKCSETVPKRIVDRLARDVEDIVCGPILEYSPLLGDDDLREIIAAGASSRALQAIARRSEVSEVVSDDIAATLDVPAIASLLTNENAQIREDTLDQIIEQAESTEDLHKPLTLRPQLSIRAMKRIATFVASSLVHQMVARSDLSEDQAENLLERVRERLSSEKVGEEEEARLAQTAMDYYRRNLLDDAFVVEQVNENRRELLIQCLAVMGDVPPDVVRKIVLSKSGRAVTALAWRCELTMKTAFVMQTELALVPPSQLLPAKNGTDFPVDENELDWHLSYFLDED
ncbi:DUF2336 domain-containing protein [Yunchengibacter salinarum]|uniref:DUF2336 domain-containing protein n=1 Tax=Yunchengibacter salinarum TaxID=3133399 RepID=UPI0035B67B1E